MLSNMYTWNLSIEKINNILLDNDNIMQCIYKLNCGDLMLLYVGNDIEPFIAKDNNIGHIVNFWRDLNIKDKSIILEIIQREILGNKKSMFYLSNPQNWEETITPEQAENLHLECLVDADIMYYVIDFITGSEVYYMDVDNNVYKHIVNIWSKIDPMYKDWILNSLQDHALDKMENPIAEII